MTSRIHAEASAIASALDERPRDTAFWQQHAEVVMGELDAIERDPAFCDGLMGLATLVAARTRNPSLVTGDVALGVVVAYVIDRCPTFSGGFDVRRWVLAHVEAEALKLLGDLDGWARTLAEMSAELRLLRIGSMEIAGDGSVTIPPDAPDTARFAVRDFQRSIGPAKPRGRRKKAAKPTGSGRKQISVEGQADSMTLDWTAWARKYALDLDLGDDKQRAAARSRWGNARQRYRLNHPD